VVAYGQILPRSVIDVAPRGTVNVHASLLPRLRGAAPIQWAIANGDAETGVTTMLIDEGLDTGPTLLARATAIGPDETAADLEPRLARLGAIVLTETIAGLAAGTVTPKPQDDTLATLAPILRKEDGRLEWTRPAAALACRARGFHPWPGAWTTFNGALVKVLRARSDAPGPGEPGVVTLVDRDGIVVGCADGTRLRLLEVQAESRKAMAASAFAAGARLAPGARFG